MSGAVELRIIRSDGVVHAAGMLPDGFNAYVTLDLPLNPIGWKVQAVRISPDPTPDRAEMVRLVDAQNAILDAVKRRTEMLPAVDGGNPWRRSMLDEAQGLLLASRIILATLRGEPLDRRDPLVDE